MLTTYASNGVGPKVGGFCGGVVWALKGMLTTYASNGVGPKVGGFCGGVVWCDMPMSAKPECRQPRQKY